LRVATTSPITFASCMCAAGLSRRVRKDAPYASVAGGDLDGIDDANDRGIDRTILHT